MRGWHGWRSECAPHCMASPRSSRGCSPKMSRGELSNSAAQALSQLLPHLAKNMVCSCLLLLQCDSLVPSAWSRPLS